MELFDVVDVIRVKRDGHVLTRPQIDWAIDAYMRGAVKDERTAALVMAIFLCGMNREETLQWTSAMIASGERTDFASLARSTADKHFIGGVGDKITLPLAPLVAVSDVAVPRLSGRGLGHTGGTLDKLKSILGWQASMSNKEIYSQLGEGCGAVIYAVDASLAPADKKLYALRDITPTVDCILLIASSIMSKKITEETGSFVPDMKVGSGAFMKDINQAYELACTVVDLGADAGVKTFAYLTDMSTSLGPIVGNALEVRELVEVLARGGPADVAELICTLARKILKMSGKTDVDVETAFKDDCAMDVWRKVIEVQGGEVDTKLPIGAESHVVFAQEDGAFHTLDALSVGVTSWRLGAGRAVEEGPVQTGAGIEIHIRSGDPVKKGQPFLIPHTDDEWRIPRALESLEGGIVVGDLAPDAVCVAFDGIE